MTEFNPDSEIEPEEEELAEEAPEQSQNRVFILVALGLGGLFVIGLICIGLYAFIVAPGQKTAQLTQVAGVNATNTQQFLNAAGTANPATDTPVPIDTSLPTDTVEALVAPSDTPVIAIIGPTATFTITNTSGPSPTPSRTPTRVGGRCDDQCCRLRYAHTHSGRRHYRHGHAHIHTHRARRRRRRPHPHAHTHCAARHRLRRQLRRPRSVHHRHRAHRRGVLRAATAVAE
jgi:hypothetical protein